MTIFYAEYHAEPLPDSEDFTECGGAYVSCWVKANSEREACDLMSAAIKETGWKIVGTEDECTVVDDLCYTEDPEGKEYFTEALKTGECYVYHQWPIEPQEGDSVH